MNKRVKNIILPTLITIITLIITNACANTSIAENLTYSVTIDPSLNITLPSSLLTLDLNPVTKTFAKKDLSVSVATNNSNGYKLTMDTTSGSGGSDGTSLVNVDDNTKTIPTLPIVLGSTSGSSITSYEEADFPVNKWGYKISSRNGITIPDANYLPFVSGTTIALNNSPVTSDTTTLTFASKIDYNQPSGLYAINLNFSGTINPTSPPYMQNLNPNLCVSEQPTLVIDSRDNRSYYIQRLKDGKCWMIQNLRLGQDLEPVTGALILTDQDTNISANDTYNPRTEFVLTNKVADGKMPNKELSDPAVAGEIRWYWDGPAFYCTDNYGCYYNFYTATTGITTEGERAVSARNTDVSTTICPKGWTMPTGGETTGLPDSPTHISQIREFLNAYGYGTESVSAVATKILVNPTSLKENTDGRSAPGLLLGGYYHGGGASPLIGVSGLYWTNTIYSASLSFSLGLDPSAIGPANYANRDSGRSVRCLLQEQ